MSEKQTEDLAELEAGSVAEGSVSVGLGGRRGNCERENSKRLGLEA